MASQELTLFAHDGGHVASNEPNSFLDDDSDGKPPNILNALPEADIVQQSAS